MLYENEDRCEDMPCDANYQCFSLNCSKDLKCIAYEAESRFNGILALLGFTIALGTIITVGIFKLCVNRITPDILRQRLAGAIKKKGKRGTRLF